MSPPRRFTLCILMPLPGAGPVLVKDELGPRPEKWPSIALTLTGFNYMEELEQ